MSLMMTDPYVASLRVLLVDDDAEALQHLHETLETLRVHTIFKANNGQEAIDFLFEDDWLSDVDVVLADWMMPQMDGLKLLKKIRSITPDLPFIMITGAGSPDTAQAAKDADVTYFLEKPYSEEELTRKLKIIGRVKLRRKAPRPESNQPTADR